MRKTSSAKEQRGRLRGCLRSGLTEGRPFENKPLTKIQAPHYKQPPWATAAECEAAKGWRAASVVRPTERRCGRSGQWWLPHTADFSAAALQHLAKLPFISPPDKGPHIGTGWHTQTNTYTHRQTWKQKHFYSSLQSWLAWSRKWQYARW